MEFSLFLVIDVPHSWPPLGTVVLYAGKADQVAYQINGKTDGSLEIVLEGEKTLRFVSVPIIFSNKGLLLLSIILQREGIRLWINGKSISEKGVQDEPISIEVNDDVRKPYLVPYSFDIPDNLSEVENHFLRSIEELFNYLNIGDRYALVRASGLLRKLLTDNNPLLIQANRIQREKIVFEAFSTHLELPETPEVCILSLVPSNYGTQETKYFSRDQFLSLPTIEIRGQSFTVKELIRYCAHSKGGVHFDQGDARDKVIRDLAKNMRIGHLEVAIEPLRDIILVVLKACEPLVRKIISASV